MNLLAYLEKNRITFTLNDAGHLSVGGSLYLEGTGITSLPDGLSVGGSLDLRGTGITSLPESFTADSVYLDPEHFSNVTYRNNCGHNNRTIFAAWVGDVPHIAAGCFWGPIHVFEKRVDNEYSGDRAEAYKAAARACIEEPAINLGKKEEKAA